MTQNKSVNHLRIKYIYFAETKPLEDDADNMNIQKHSCVFNYS